VFHLVECHSAACRNTELIMLGVTVLRVIFLNVIVLFVILLIADIKTNIL
jgi:hypothetical protein